MKSFSLTSYTCKCWMLFTSQKRMVLSHLSSYTVITMAIPYITCAQGFLILCMWLLHARLLLSLFLLYFMLIHHCKHSSLEITRWSYHSLSHVCPVLKQLGSWFRCFLNVLMSSSNRSRCLSESRKGQGPLTPAFRSLLTTSAHSRWKYLGFARRGIHNWGGGAEFCKRFFPLSSIPLYSYLLSRWSQHAMKIKLFKHTFIA